MARQMKAAKIRQQDLRRGVISLVSTRSRMTAGNFSRVKTTNRGRRWSPEAAVLTSGLKTVAMTSTMPQTMAHWRTTQLTCRGRKMRNSRVVCHRVGATAGGGRVVHQDLVRDIVAEYHIGVGLREQLVVEPNEDLDEELRVACADGALTIAKSAMQ